MSKTGSIILAALVLAACAAPGVEQEETSAVAEDEATEAAVETETEHGLMADVSGAVSTGVTGPGNYVCVEGRQGGLPGRIVISSHPDQGADPGLLFEIPVDARPGTYDLVGQGNMDSELGVDYRVSLKVDADSLGVGNYDEGVEGQLTLDALPREPQDPVRGSFRFSAVDAENSRAEGEGEFDFRTPDSRMSFCNEAGQ